MRNSASLFLLASVFAFGVCGLAHRPCPNLKPPSAAGSRDEGCARGRERPPEMAIQITAQIRKLLEEIYRSIDAENVRLPMMGARSLVDMMVLEKIGDVGTFREKLVELEKGGFISPRNREALYAALEVGNAAAHRGHAAKESEVHDVMDIVETMLTAIYVFPELAQKLKRATPPRHRRSPKGS